MKTILFLMMMTLAVVAKAQYADDDMSTSSLRAGVAYTRDFPGVTGPAVFAQYSFPLNEWLQGGVGVKHIHAAGYPRTTAVREYTKANTLDFELLFVPVHTEHAALRVGLTYTFSFYDIRRSYPLYTSHDGQAATISYPVADSKGRVHGTGITAEYEHSFGSSISGGLKVQVTKAYDGVVMAGPFVAIHL